MIEIANMLKKLAIPFAYDHFAEGEYYNPPYIVYSVKSSSNRDADGLVFYPIYKIEISLYTGYKDPVTENKLEEILNQNGLPFEKSETYLTSERLYRMNYEITKGG